MNSFQNFSLCKVCDLYCLTLLIFFCYSAFVYPTYPTYFFMHMVFCHGFNVLDLFSDINYVCKHEFICICLYVIWQEFQKDKIVLSTDCVSLSGLNCYQTSPMLGKWPCAGWVRTSMLLTQAGKNSRMSPSENE